MWLPSQLSLFDSHFGQLNSESALMPPNISPLCQPASSAFLVKSQQNDENSFQHVTPCSAGFSRGMNIL